MGGTLAPSSDASHAAPAGPSAVTGRPEEASYLCRYLNEPCQHRVKYANHERGFRSGPIPGVHP